MDAPAVAFLMMIVNASSWSSTDVRVSRFASMDACQAALSSMKITHNHTTGASAGMVSMAYCTHDPTADVVKSYFSDVPASARQKY